MSAKIKPTNFLTCLYGCALGHHLERPQKLNPENFPSDQLAKIGPLEISHYMVCSPQEVRFTSTSTNCGLVCENDFKRRVKNMVNK